MKPSISMGPSSRHVVRIAIISAMLLLGVECAPAFAATSPHNAKKLSMSSVTISLTASSSDQAEWIAQKQGYFKAAGLNVTLEPILSSSADEIAALVGGATQFGVFGANSLSEAVANGAQLRAIMQTNNVPDGIAISSSYAAAHNIPAIGSTAAGAKAQFLALKGTHIQIAISNITSGSYVVLNAAAATYGLSIGVNNPSDDIDLVPEGTVPDEIVALDAGQVPAFANTEPNILQPNTIEIKEALLPIVKKGDQIYIGTTTSMIKSHPDTVAAVVGAILKGWNYQKTHPAGALKDLTSLYVSQGVTSEEQIVYLVQSCTINAGSTVQISPTSYAFVEHVTHLATPSTDLPSFKAFVDTKFVQAAIKEYGLTK